MTLLHSQTATTGILPICKSKGVTSFSLVGLLRRITRIRTIGHAGTLDPFAEGVMLLLIGKQYTRLSSSFLNQDKEYVAKIHLGIETDSYDIDGEVVRQDPHIPTLAEIEKALLHFQGTFLQTPPMFSAKKVGGKKLYELARKGITIERESSPVTARCTLIDYTYPEVHLKVECSKGTYIRSIAHDLGKLLGCGAHLSALTRTRSGRFALEHCCDMALLHPESIEWQRYLHLTPP